MTNIRKSAYHHGRPRRSRAPMVRAVRAILRGGRLRHGRAHHRRRCGVVRHGDGHRARTQAAARGAVGEHLGQYQQLQDGLWKMSTRWAAAIWLGAWLLGLRSASTAITSHSTAPDAPPSHSNGAMASGLPCIRTSRCSPAHRRAHSAEASSEIETGRAQ